MGRVFEQLRTVTPPSFHNPVDLGRCPRDGGGRIQKTSEFVTRRSLIPVDVGYVISFNTSVAARSPVSTAPLR
jgi:hypothetical protein